MLPPHPDESGAWRAYTQLARPCATCSPQDHRRKKNCKVNPWCPFGLGERKEGIWRLSVNDGDATDLQKLPGMKNLGATCYVNVVLQTLARNSSFRRLLLSLDVDESSEFNVALTELQCIVHMISFSRRGPVDTRLFVDALKISTTVQQDPQEFFKLLLSTMEASVASPEVKQFKDLFRGQDTCYMICERCGDVRSSSNLFEELCLSIDANTTLERAIEKYFASELLDGDDGCFCPRCQRRTDTTRNTVLERAPRLLNIQLLRYKFDKHKQKKIKVDGAVEFSRELDLHCGTYQLVGAIYHKGASANGGHYVCDVWDQTLRCWLHCNDDIVTLLEGDWLALEDRDGAPSAKKAKKDAAASDTKKSESRHRTVYTLFYARKDHVEWECAQRESALSPLLLERVDVRVAAIEHEVLRSQQCKFAECLREEERRLCFEQIEGRMIPKEGEGFHILPTSWLQRWVVGDDLVQVKAEKTLGSVGNQALLCPHGHLRLASIKDCKVLSDAAFAKIFADPLVRGLLDVDISSSNFRCSQCPERLEQWSQALACDALSMEAIARAVESDLALDMSGGERLWWLSKSWLLRLTRHRARLSKMLASVESEDLDFSLWEEGDLGSLRISAFGAEGVNAALLCKQHNGLVGAVGSRAQRVTEATWRLVEAAFANAVELPVDTPVCQQCAIAADECGLLAKQTKALRASQQSDKFLRRLMKHPRYVESLDPSEAVDEYYLTDSRWIEEWRAFVGGSSSPLPPPLLNAALCCHHGLTLASPDVLVAVGASIGVVSAKPSSGVELCSSEEWQRLVSNWTDLDRGAAFAVRLRRTGERSSVWSVDPPVCFECVAERESKQLERNRLFEGSSLEIQFVKDCMPTGDLSLRRKTRARGTKTVFVTASHGDTLGLLKIKIFEAITFMDLPPHRQQLFHPDGTELLDLSQSLRELGIQANMVITVAASDAEEEDWSFLEEPHEVELGFSGSVFAERRLDSGTTEGGDVFDLTGEEL